MDLDVSKLGHTEKAPMDLLFKADPSVEMIEKYLYSGECYLARLSDEVVGAFVIQPINEEEMELKNLSVETAHQGKGVGKEIVKFVSRISKMEGYQFLVVKTADSSVDAIAYYKSLKFKEYFISKGHYLKYYEQPIIEGGKQAVDQVVLRKRL